MKNKIKIGQQVFIVTKTNKLVTAIVIGYTEYSIGHFPVAVLESPNGEGWTQIVITDSVLVRTAFEE